MRPHARAFTLTELMIALAIFMSVMAAILQVTVTARSYESTAAAQDDLSADSERCLRMIGEDLTLSGWHIPDKTTSTAQETACDASGSDLGRLSSDLAVDRTKRYFPYVIGSGTGTSPTGAAVTRANTAFFPYAALDASVAIQTAAVTKAMVNTSAPAADITALGATAAATWYGSYIGPSQSLIFLRVFTYDGVHAIDDALPLSTRRAQYASYLKGRGPSLNFGASNDSDLSNWTTNGKQSVLGISYASQLYESSPGVWSLRAGASDTVAYGVPMESGYVITGSDGALRIQPQWETLDVPSHTLPADENDYREYIYTVVRSPISNRLGRLVRAHKETITATPLVRGVEVGQVISGTAMTAGQDVFVVDQVLSDNVVRITFDTYRTDRFTSTDQGRLDVNQIRVRLYLARTDQMQRIALSRVAMATFTMRAKNTETQRTDDLTLLGPNRPGYPR